MTTPQRLTSFLFLGTLFLVSLFWCTRWIWTYRYDHEVMKNWYDHSQWSIPLSPRVMGDAELYQYASEQLVNGVNPFAVNPEVPPLAKYFYGLAIRFTGDPYLASAIIYLATVATFGWIAFLFFDKDKADTRSSVDLSTIRSWAWLLFLTSPLFFSQMGQITLDLPQLLFMLLHIGTLWCVSRTELAWQRVVLTLLSGIMLGAFAATKFAVFAPLLGLLAWWWLWRQRQTKYILVLTVAAVATYPATYLPFFFQGHGLLEWLRSQKWVVNFYLSNHVQFLPFMVFVTLFTGFYSGWWKNATTWVNEWTILWPVATAVTLWQIYTYRLWKLILQRAATIKEKVIGNPLELHAQHLYVMLLCAGLLLMIAVIPFWPRYLTLLLPLLILCSAKWLARQSTLVRVAILGICFTQAIFALFPAPDNLMRVASQAMENQSYPELHRLISAEDQRHFSPQEFTRTFQTIDNSLKSTQKTAQITLPQWTWPWQSSQTGQLELKYTTPFGTFVHRSPITFVRENNDWRVKWDWATQLPHFQMGNEVVLTTDPYQTGQLFTSDGQVVSKDGPAPFLSVTPSLIPNDPDETLLKQLSLLTNIAREKIRIRLFVTGDPNTSVPLGFAIPGYNPTVFEVVKTNPAVTITELPNRAYHPTLVSKTDTDHNYLGIAQTLESQHPELLGKMGGKISIQTQDGEYIIFESPSQNGQDVKLTQSFQELFGVTLEDLDIGKKGNKLN